MRFVCYFLSENLSGAEFISTLSLWLRGNRARTHSEYVYDLKCRGAGTAGFWWGFSSVDYGNDGESKQALYVLERLKGSEPNNWRAMLWEVAFLCWWHYAAKGTYKHYAAKNTHEHIWVYEGFLKSNSKCMSVTGWHYIVKYFIKNIRINWDMLWMLLRQKKNK